MLEQLRPKDEVQPEGVPGVQAVVVEDIIKRSVQQVVSVDALRLRPKQHLGQRLQTLGPVLVQQGGSDDRVEARQQCFNA